jgi:hypothetical protein
VMPSRRPLASTVGASFSDGCRTASVRLDHDGRWPPLEAP